jgi:C1A family cysteine protease
LHFKDNSIDIHSNNDNFAAGKGSFEMDQNKFCDMPQDEFEFLNTGIKNRASRSASSEPRIQGKNVMNFFMPSPMLESQVEESFDWREKGAITPVKNQGEIHNKLLIFYIL